MYKSQIPSFDNEKLLKVFKNYLEKKSSISSYNEFNETEKQSRRDKDLQNVLSQTRKELQSLKDSLQSEIEKKQSEINSICYPNITKDVSITNEKSYGAVEFGNSLALYQLKPNGLLEILKTGLAHKRNDFVFLTLDLFMKDKELSLGEKNKVQNIYDEISQQVGIADKKKQLEKSELFFDETNDSLDLIVASPQEFDRSVNSTFKVFDAMQQAGQL